MIRLAFAVPVSFLFLACTVETEVPGRTPAPSSSTETSPPLSAAKPEVAFSCSGEIARRDVGLGGAGLGLRCIGGGPNVDCGGAPSPCAAQDVAFSYAPPATDCDVGQRLFFWNGSACVGQKVVGGDGNLVCKGTDCEKLYKTEEACKAAYDSCPK